MRFEDYLSPEELTIWVRINDLDPDAALAADLMLRRRAEMRGWVCAPQLVVAELDRITL